MNSHFLRLTLGLIACIAVASPFSARAVIKIRVTTFELGQLPALVPYVFRSDRDGNSLVVGGTINPEASDEVLPHLRVSRFDTAQNLLWSALYDPPTTREQVTDVAWASTGDVFVTGYSVLGNFFNESVTLKYDSAGTPVWTNRFRPAGGQSQGRFISTDADGNAAVVYTTDTEAVLAKLNGDGTTGWTYPLGNLAPLAPAPSEPGMPGAGVAFDPAGNVLVTRSVALNGTNARPVVLTVKLSAEGVPLWTNRYEKGMDRHSGIIPQAVTTDRFGNVFVAAFSSRLLVNTPTRQRAAQRVTILSYSPGGRLRWARHLQDKDALAHLITPRALITDSDGGVYVSGARPLPARRDGDPNYCGIHTARFTAKGELVWRKRHTAGLRANYALRFVRANAARVTLHMDEAWDPVTVSGSPWLRTTVNYLKEEDEED